MKVYNYLNPFSREFKQATKDFKDLSPKDKRITLILTVFAGLATVIFFGIGGYATFQSLVKKFKPLPKDSEPTRKTSEVFGKTIFSSTTPPTQSTLGGPSEGLTLSGAPRGMPLPLNGLNESSSEKGLNPPTDPYSKPDILELSDATQEGMEEKGATPDPLKEQLLQALNNGLFDPALLRNFKNPQRETHSETQSFSDALEQKNFKRAKEIFEKGADPSPFSPMKVLSSLLFDYQIYKNMGSGEQIKELFNAVLSKITAEELNKLMGNSEEFESLLLTEACRVDLEFVQALVEKGADVTLQLGVMLPINAAIRNGKVEIVQYLLEKGGYFAKDSLGTSFAHAVGYGQIRYEMVDLMIKNRASQIDEPIPPNPQIAGRKGFSPLHYAIEIGDERLVQLLISGEANLDLPLSFDTASYQAGTTPLKMAEMKGFPKIEQLLKEAGAKEQTGGVFVPNKADYKALELDETASFELVKRQYKKLALKWHPDKAKASGVNEEDAKKRFDAIKTAYENLEKKFEKQAEPQLATGGEEGEGGESPIIFKST